MTAPAIAQQLVRHINAHDVTSLLALLAPDHRLVDSLGAVLQGRDALRDGWTQYFRMVPDYRIEVETVVVQGPIVVLLGVARGTYTPDGALRPENAWSTPAVWQAVVRDGLVAEWRIYADNEPMRRCMARAPA